MSKVICISNDSELLTYGKIYDVIEINDNPFDNIVYIKDDTDTVRGYNKRKFKDYKREDNLNKLIK